MKRDSYKLFDFSRRYDNDVTEDMTKVVSNLPVVDEDNDKPRDSLLRIIYTPDARTGLPTGDLGYLVSDKANPQVKQFILDNLMQDVSSAVTPSAQGLSDDDILALSRNVGESVEAYAARLNQSIERDRWFIENSTGDVSQTGASVSSE